jgi:hypothetical protein
VARGCLPVGTLLVLAALVLSLVVGAGPAYAATRIGAITFSSNTTWTAAGSPYVLDGDVTVAAGVTLTISPGVVVKLNGESRTLRVNGTLSAIGTQSSPITFTSYKDDSAGGDTNEDGSATSGAPGQWCAITFNSSGSQLTWVNIRDGGSGSAQNYAPVSLFGSGYSVSLDHAAISNNQYSAIAVGGGASATITNSLLTHNGYGLYVNQASATVDHSTISDNTSRGVWFNLPNLTPLPPASTIMNSDVAHNGGAGVYIGANGDYPLQSMPHGSRDNIYANNNGGLQLDVVGYPGWRLANVNWRGNYWGNSVYYWHHNSLCTTTSPYSNGHLAYLGAAGNVPAGPITWGSYFVQQGPPWISYWCGWDAFVIGPNEFSPTYIDTAGRMSSAEALAQFVPQIRYDSQESFRADAASEITDNYGGPDDFNMLMTWNYGYLAASGPDHPVDPLALDYLGQEYPGGRTATENDYINEGPNYTEDAGRMHALADYGNKVYGRVVRYDDTGERIVQYWLFYYYNGPFPFDDHEGDWEMVQYDLDYNGNPISAAYAQHDGSERCDWTHVQRTPDGHPIIYPSFGGHASFFSSGRHVWQGGAYFDEAGGDGEVVTPSVIDVTTAPAWIYWPGRWGKTGNKSPVGPGKHGGTSPGGQWADPRGWANLAGSCTEGQTYSPYRVRTTRGGLRIASVRLPLPTVWATRMERLVVAHYKFRQDTRLKGLELVTSVDSTSDRRPPVTTLVPIRRHIGTFTRRLPAGRGPFRLLVSVISARGERTRPIVIPLK